MLQPMISVGMPVYNGEQYIGESIQCVLDQTNENFELIICDNASTDNTEDICKRFAQKDKRISYVRNKTNIGAAKNYNLVFSKTSGKYFRWHNADDLCSPKLHELCLSVLRENSENVLCYGKTQIIDSEGEIIESYDDNLNLYQNSPFERYKAFFRQIGLTNVIYGLMRRSAVEKTMLMGNGTFFASDVNFMAEMTLYGKFHELPDTLFYRRMHIEASSWDRKDEVVQQEFWHGKRNIFTLPIWKKDIAYLKAVKKAPINESEKIKLYGFNLRRMFRHRHKLLKDLISEIQNRNL